MVYEQRFKPHHAHRVKHLTAIKMFVSSFIQVENNKNG